jgi:hypothetical protein
MVRTEFSRHSGLRGTTRIFADLQTYNVSRLTDLQVKSCGIPHLAKNERDMGHPMIRAQDGVQLQLLRNAVIG